MHDNTQVARVFTMHKSLVDGMFPVRWVSDLGYGYGYPIYNFYAPFAYYIGGFINLATDSLTATKAMMVIGVLLSGIFMYYFARSLWGAFGGIVAAMLYMYAPYHALDIYVRGDVGECYAYAFIPLAFFGIYKILLIGNENAKRKTQNEKKQFKIQKYLSAIVIGSLGFAGIILSHNLTAMMVTPFLFGFVLLLWFFSKKQKAFVFGVFVSALLALLLSAFYWLPVFPELKYTDVLSQIGGGADYRNHFVCAHQLWDSPWGYGGSTFTCVDGLSFKIGKVHIILAGLSILLILIQIFSSHLKKIQPRTFFIVGFLAGSLCISIFLLGEESKFLWDAFPPMAFFQYPWRFLLLVSFFISVLGGGVIFFFQGIFSLRWQFFLNILISGILIVFIIVVNADIFVPQSIFSATAKSYTNEEALHWEASKLTDEYLPKGFDNPKMENQVPTKKIVIPKGKGSMISFHETTTKITATFEMKTASKILLQQAYFPAWHVMLDGKEIAYKKSSRGMVIVIPQGKHTLEVTFIETPIEKLGNILFFAGIVVLILGIIVSRSNYLVFKSKVFKHFMT